MIVPHGPLMLLSFAPLTNDRGVALVERHTISYAPALSVFRYTGAHRVRPGMPPGAAARSALIVADPLPPADAGLDRLPGTLQEGRAVRQRIGDADALLLSGATATEAAVKRSAGSRRVLHLATHGLVSQQRPLASSLLFAQGEGDDGYLRADEVFGLTLNADLVVLSGCSTGLGRLSGEGMLGLTRSFFFAGAASLVVSYWDVSDAATTELMDRFYAALAQGRNKAEALRIAQIETRRRHPHPALWAAFVLQGEL
jgi:CHAT domain-containing protein